MNHLKRLHIIVLILAMVVIPMVHAQNATPSSTVEAQDKIDSLKERLATKVAELRKSIPKAVTGTVSDVSISQVTIDVGGKAIKIELPDEVEVKQIIRTKMTDLDTDDIDKNDRVTVFGSFDETLDVLTPTTVFIEPATFPKRIHGFITEIDEDDFTVTIRGLDNVSYTLDIETSTRTNGYTPADGIQKSGFSQLESGMFLSVLGTEHKTIQDRLTATRILHLPSNADSNPSPLGGDEAQSATPTPADEDE